MINKHVMYYFDETLYFDMCIFGSTLMLYRNWRKTLGWKCCAREYLSNFFVFKFIFVRILKLRYNFSRNHISSLEFDLSPSTTLMTFGMKKFSVFQLLVPATFIRKWNFLKKQNKLIPISIRKHMRVGLVFREQNWNFHC